MKKNITGFTLTELMVTLVIAVIIAAFGYPSYIAQVAKGKRAGAQAALLEMAQLMETSRTSSGTYPAVTLPYCSLPKSTSPCDSTDTYIDYTITLIRTSTSYTINAIPLNKMKNDQCGTFSIDSTGSRSLSSQASGVTVSNCWVN